MMANFKNENLDVWKEDIVREGQLELAPNSTVFTSETNVCINSKRAEFMNSQVFEDLSMCAVEAGHVIGFADMSGARRLLRAS